MTYYSDIYLDAENNFSQLWQNITYCLLKSCTQNNNCNGMRALLRDWFGDDLEQIEELIQTIIWANNNGGELNLCLSNCNHENVIPLFDVINAINNCNHSKKSEMANRLFGRFGCIAIPQLETLSHKIAKIFGLGENNYHKGAFIH
jgi:hypothetical protein